MALARVRGRMCAGRERRSRPYRCSRAGPARPDHRDGGAGGRPAVVANAWHRAIPALDPLASASWSSWTSGHLPLAGRWELPAIVVTACSAVVLLGVGIAAFARRDVGVTVSLPTPALPGALLGIRGPAARTLGDALPTAVAWGLGLGVWDAVGLVACGALAIGGPLAGAWGMRRRDLGG